MPRVDNAELHTEREWVCIKERGEKSIIPQQENALQKLNPFLLAGLSLVFLVLPLYTQDVQQRSSPEHTNLRGLQPSTLLSDSKHLAVENLPCISVFLSTVRVYFCLHALVLILTKGLHQLRLHAVGYQRIGQLWEEALHCSCHRVHRHVLLDQVNVRVCNVQKERERLWLNFQMDVCELLQLLKPLAI